MSPSNLLSLLLIILTCLSYIPQYNRLLTLHSSNGISLISTLLTTLVSQSQTVTIYYLFHYAPMLDHDVPIATPPSSRDWLNLTQILVQWLASLLLFVLVISLPSPTPPPNSSSSILSKKTAVLLLISHVVLFLLSISMGGRPQDLIFNIIRDINACIANPFFTCLSCSAFVFQALAIPAMDQLNGLSTWTLGLQTLVFGLLAFSWPFRLLMPANLWEVGSGPVLLREWYPWVGWACVNNAVMAVGQGLMLLVYIRRGGVYVKSGFVDERRSLLGGDEL